MRAARLRGAGAHRDAGYIQRLRVSLAVDGIGKQLPKCVAVDIAGSKDRFVEVLTSARNIIVLRHYVGLRLGPENQKRQHREHYSKPRSPGTCGFQWNRSPTKEIFH